MASPATPDATEIRRRGRRRLIGAVAIVLLLVVFVPMILDSDPRPARGTPDMKIPPRDNAPPLPPPQGARPGSTALVPGKPLPPDIPPAKAIVEAVKPPPVVPKTAEATSAPEKAADASRAAPAAAKAAEAPTAPTSPEKAPEAPKAASVTPRPVDSAKPSDAAKPAPSAKGSDAAKPAPSAKATDAAKPAPADAPKAPAAPAQAAEPKLEGFAIAVGAFRDDDKLRQAREKLVAAGVVHYTERLENPSGPLTRLRAGPFPTRAAADGALAKVRAVAPEAKVVPLP